MMQRRITVRIPQVDVGIAFFNQVARGIKPVVGDMTMRMRHEILPVACSRGCMNRKNIRSAHVDPRQSRRIELLLLWFRITP